MILLTADDGLTGASTYALERGEPAVRVETRGPATGIQIDTIAPMDDSEEDEGEIEAEETEATVGSARSARKTSS